ncbi:D-alanyl-D-alanine carboxypeptidase [Novosphingobium lubricantis]|jgi:UV DNA damage repair endonuclease
MNTTIRAESADATAFWNDHATVLRREAAGGVFHGFATLHAGSFAEMVRLVTRLPESQRAELVVEKAGDRQYSVQEVLALARRADFPG